MTKQKIYISGGITNNPDYKKQFVSKYYELEGQYTVLSPLMINAALSWDEYMHIDYSMIDVCDCIYMMKGYENSKGAKLEELYAKEKGKQIIYE